MTQRRQERRETEQGDSEEEALMGGTIRPGTRPGEVEVADGKRWLMGGVGRWEVTEGKR